MTLVTDARDIAVNGPFVAAAGISIAAGLVSFASPCILPLIPGYIGYVSGVSGAEAATGGAKSRATVLAGALLFVAGFATVFAVLGAAVGGMSDVLLQNRELVGRLGGVIVLAMGLFLLGVWRPRQLQKDTRALSLVRKPGVAAAFPLGIVFGAGWTPCMGPTLAGILTLGSLGTDTSAVRGAALAFLYALGLGIPFVLVALLFRHGLAVIGFLRRHATAIERFGGALLVVVGLLLITGLWDRVILELMPFINGYDVPL